MTHFHLGRCTLRYRGQPRGKHSHGRPSEPAQLFLCYCVIDAPARFPLNLQIINLSPSNQRFFRWWWGAELPVAIKYCMALSIKYEEKMRGQETPPTFQLRSVFLFISNVPVIPPRGQTRSSKAFLHQFHQRFEYVWKLVPSAASKVGL